MKKTMITAFAITVILMGIFFSGCEKKEETMDDTVYELEDKIADFYYTYENINYNAFYQRYRFYTDGDRKFFFHEQRQVKDDYGPTSEKDVTRKGEYELNDQEWKKFVSMLDKGTYRNRQESAESGDSGPWLYIYLKKDPSKQLEFSFPSYGELKDFEAYCEKLASR